MLILRRDADNTHVSLLPDKIPHTRDSQEELSLKDFEILQLKQRKLQDPNGQVPKFIHECHKVQSTETPLNDSASNSLAQAAAATLVFAQEEAGTAVCISSAGLILTCSHCVAEMDGKDTLCIVRWLLFASGKAVRAKCVAWNPKRDLALLQIVAAQPSPSATHDTKKFPFAILGGIQEGELLCIGNPGSEDLEAPAAGMATDYDVLHISNGRFRGLARDQDPAG